MKFLKDVLVWGAVVRLLVFLALLVMSAMYAFVTLDTRWLASDLVLAEARFAACAGLFGGVIIAILQDE